MLNLYMNPVSSNSQKVLFFLEETGIPFKSHMVNLAKGEQNAAAFVDVNAFSAVPAIEDNGFKLAESLTILRYLAQKHGKHTFYPDNLEERAKVDQIADFTTLHVGRWSQSLVWNLVIAPMIGQTANQALVEEARRQLTGYLPRLERYFTASSATSYLCGPTLTIADCAFAPTAAGLARAGVSVRDFPLTAGYIQRVTDRPAFKKVQAEAMKLMGAR